MNEISDAELERIARDAADQIAGAGAVANVAVEPGLNSLDEPVYRFSFIMNDGHALSERPGLVLIRLGQTVRDALADRGDPTRPEVQMISQADWDKYAHA
jgi:hypothetical protein